MSATVLPDIYVLNLPGVLANSYEIGAGAFGYRIENYHYFHNCRDNAQTVESSKYQQGLVFSHLEHKGRNVAEFLNKTEEILQLTVKTVFKYTDYTTCLWLRPSPFWLSSPIRRSFLTIALRCGQSYNYHKDNFQQALKSIRYAQETQPAIQRFLDGFTQYCGAPPESKGVGWYRIFSVCKNIENVKALLKAGHELIAQRAYLKYLNRKENNIHGDTDQDWHAAVSELDKE